MKNTKTAIFDTAKSIPYIGSYLNLASKVKSIPDAIFMDKMEGFAAGQKSKFELFQKKPTKL